MSWRRFFAKLKLWSHTMSSEEINEVPEQLRLPYKPMEYFLHMTRMPTIRFATMFVGKIFIFGFVYWVIFFIKPDSFNFANGFNSKPLSNFLGEFYETDVPSAVYALDFQAAVSRFKDESLELKSRYEQSSLLENERTALEAAFDELYRELDKDRAKEVDIYNKKNIEPLESESEEIEQKLSSRDYSTQQRVDLRTRNLEISKKLLAHHSFVLSNFGQFGSADLRDRIQDEDQKLQIFREKHARAEEDYREKRVEVYDAFMQARADIFSSIGLVDFLYFSACVSTTTTFGDITANNRWVRLLVVLQILIGIMILAFFIQSITAKIIQRYE